MKVEYYDLRALSIRNTGIIVTLGPWPPRVLKARGWTPERKVYSRLATSGEEAEVLACTRCMSWRYQTVDGLLEDERSIEGIIEEEISLLETLFSR